MVEYKCECCQYSTNRKLNYDRHLSSDKHLKQLNNSTQQVENKNEDNYLENRIKELEEIIKNKDELIEEIIKNKDELIEKQENEINHLKEQLSNNNTLIKPNENTLFKAKLIPKVKKEENIKIEVKEMKLEPKPNLNIEEFFEKYIRKGGETKYTFLYPLKGAIYKPVIKFGYLQKGYIFKLKKVIQELFLNGLKELPDGVSFYEVINKKTNKFRVKTKDRIITTKNDEKELDKCLKTLMVKICDFLRGSITSFVYSFSKDLEFIDSDDNEIIREARNKKLFKETLTSREDHLLKKDDNNCRIKENFKKITGINFDNFYENWYNNEIMSQFTLLDEDAEYKHFKVLMARKEERVITDGETETETEQEETEQEETEEEE
jgi:hypothetical protein